MAHNTGSRRGWWALAATMLLVTHEISFASDIADRVLMFDAGKIVEDAPPAQVLKDPAHPRTRQFLRAILER